MENLRSLSDETLLQKTKTLVKEEREVTLRVLHHLREVERRRLFAQIGYPSLFEYCVRELGYSESSAQRRIASMRLVREIPELEEKIADGRLSLSVVSQAQKFFKREAVAEKALSRDQKKEVLESLEHKSAREAERELIQLSSNPAEFSSERVRPVSETHSELRLVISEVTLQDLERLRGLLAHSHPNLSFSELIELLARQALARMDPAREPSRKSLSTSQPTETLKNRSVPARVRRAVWRRDHGRCTYEDPKSGRRCGSQHALQIDHRIPFARGGTSTLENLRLLCANHNQLEADREFGRDWMTKRRAGPDVG